MRSLLVALFAVCVACSSNPAASPVDSGSSTDVSTATDAGFDAPDYGADDFSSFRYSFLGTGISGSFAMDRDCGIDAEGELGFGGSRVPTGSGVVPAADCETFKAFTLSSDVLAGYAKWSALRECSLAGDDYITSAIATADGKTYAVGHVSGCSLTEPFKTLRTEMTRLANSYVTATDAGSD